MGQVVDPTLVAAARGASRGDVLYYGASGWARLAVGTNGQVIASNGTDPAYTTISTGLTVGTTSISSGNTGRVLYDNGGTLGEYPVTGSAGSVVLSASPTLTGVPVVGTAVGVLALGLETNGSSTGIVGVAATNTNTGSSGASASLRLVCDRTLTSWFTTNRSSASSAYTAPDATCLYADGLGGVIYCNYNASGAGHHFRVGTGTTDILGVSQTTQNILVTQSATGVIGQVVKGIASRTAALVQLQTSAGGSLGNVGGSIADDYTSVSTTHTDGTADDLFSKTLVANTFANNGDAVRWRVFLSIVGHATATRRIKVVFAGTTILDTTALTAAATCVAVIDVLLERVSSTVVRYGVTVTAPGLSATVAPAAGEVTGLTLTATNVLKVTGTAADTGAASGDIVAYLGKMFRDEFGS